MRPWALSIRNAVTPERLRSSLGSLDTGVAAPDSPKTVRVSATMLSSVVGFPGAGAAESRLRGRRGSLTSSMATCAEESRPSTRYSLPLRLTRSMRVTLPLVIATWLTTLAGASEFLLELPAACAGGAAAVGAGGIARGVCSAVFVAALRNFCAELRIEVSCIVVSPWNWAAWVRCGVGLLRSYV